MTKINDVYFEHEFSDYAQRGDGICIRTKVPLLFDDVDHLVDMASCCKKEKIMLIKN